MTTFEFVPATAGAQLVPTYLALCLSLLNTVALQEERGHLDAFQSGAREPGKAHMLHVGTDKNAILSVFQLYEATAPARFATGGHDRARVLFSQEAESGRALRLPTSSARHQGRRSARSPA